MMEAGLGEYADPRSVLRATAMLLRHIGQIDSAQKLEEALAICPVTVTGDRNGATCQAYVDALLKYLQ